MAELMSLADIPKSVRLRLLKELGYGSDGIHVVDSQGNKVIDRYINEPVKVENMLILPGSTIILDNNPLSVSSYLLEFGDVL